jgi:hypothetical protein
MADDIKDILSLILILYPRCDGVYLEVLIMKKKNVLNSIKYYAGKNNTAFRLDKKYGAGM